MITPCSNNPDAWFPDKGETTTFPVRVCQGCGFRKACAKAALALGETHGVWAGVALSNPSSAHWLQEIADKGYRTCPQGHRMSSVGRRGQETCGVCMGVAS